MSNIPYIVLGVLILVLFAAIIVSCAVFLDIAFVAPLFIGIWGGAFFTTLGYLWWQGF